MDAIRFARFIAAIKDCEAACRDHGEDHEADAILNALEYALQEAE